MANDEIYKITFYLYRNKINGKPYVGQTSNFNKRAEQHIIQSNNSPKMYIDRAIAKYGIENFDISIIECIECISKVADEIEFRWMIEFNSMVPNGYNVKPGGKTARGWRHSEETKKKLSIVHMGQPSGMKGKNHSNEANEKNRQAHLGKSLSEETIEKIVKANTGKKRTNEQKQNISNSLKGKTLSEEHKKALSISHMGYVMPDEQKQKISNGNKGKIVSEKTKEKISKSQIGKVIPEEVREKISKTLAGRKNPERRKLSDEQIFAILKDKRSSRIIAKDYNVSNITILRVKNGIAKPIKGE